MKIIQLIPAINTYALFRDSDSNSELYFLLPVEFYGLDDEGEIHAFPFDADPIFESTEDIGNYDRLIKSNLFINHDMRTKLEMKQLGIHIK